MEKRDYTHVQMLLPEIKAMLAQHTIGEMEAAAERALACRTEAEVIALVDSLL